MGRSPCCDEPGLTKGHWTQEEDQKLEEYILKHGHKSWRALPKLAGLNRCSKSCRLRWTNYLRPDIKRGPFSEKEEQLIIQLHSSMGNKWSAIAKKIPGRTDNEIKNYWNTHLRKKLLHMGIDPVTHRPRPDLTLLASIPSLLAAAAANMNSGFPTALNPFDSVLRIQSDAAQLAKAQLIQSLAQVLSAAGCSSSSGGGTTGSTSTAMNNPMLSSTTSPFGSSSLLKNTQLPNCFQNTSQLMLNNGTSTTTNGDCYSSGFPNSFPTQITSLSNFGITDDHVDPRQSYINIQQLLNDQYWINSLDANNNNNNNNYGMIPQMIDQSTFLNNDPMFGLDQNSNINPPITSGSYSQMSSPCTNPTSNSIPSIVSTNSTDHNFTVEQIQDQQPDLMINSSTANSSTAINTCDDPWKGVNYFDDFSCSFYWDNDHDLLDKCSSPTWSDSVVYKADQPQN